MPTQKPYDRYDKRLVKLLDRALTEPVLIRRKFRTFSKANTFRMHLYQLRYAARLVGKKARWDELEFHIIGADLVLGASGVAFSTRLQDILDGIDVDIGDYAEIKSERRRGA